MDNLGYRPVGSTIYFKFTTSDGNGGAVAPLTAFEAADVTVYKDGSATQRTSQAGWTMTSPFDSVVGLHHLAMDLSDNTDAGFWAAGSHYSVCLIPDTETVNLQTIVRVLFDFDIGVAPANVTQNAGAAITSASGVQEVKVASIATDAITAASIATDAIDAAALKADAVTEITVGVVDQALSGHTSAGTVGGALNSASSAGDPWATALPGSYSSGQAGKIVGDNINSPLGAIKTLLDAVAGYIDTEVAAIKAQTDKLNFGLTNQVDANIKGYADQNIVVPGTAGLPDINVKNWSGAVVAVPTVSGYPLVDTNLGRHATAQGGGASTITLDGSASATDNLYSGQIVYIESGTGARQSRLIIGYVGSTKVATVSRAWATNPDNTSVFKLIPGEVNLAAVVLAAQTAGDLAALIAAISSGSGASTADILAMTYEGSESFGEYLKLTRASLLGEVSGGPDNPVFKSLDGLTDRITADVDVDTGDRSNVTTDPS